MEGSNEIKGTYEVIGNIVVIRNDEYSITACCQNKRACGRKVRETFDRKKT
jgi:hypothetical protein